MRGYKDRIINPARKLNLRSEQWFVRFVRGTQLLGEGDGKSGRFSLLRDDKWGKGIAVTDRVIGLVIEQSL